MKYSQIIIKKGWLYCQKYQQICSKPSCENSYIDSECINSIADMLVASADSVLGYENGKTKIGCGYIAFFADASIFLQTPVIFE